MKEYFKIMEQTDDWEGVKTLFHGVQGSRKLPFGKWIKAEIKPGCSESSGRKYTSGFHVVESAELCDKYFQLFKNKTNRRIFLCHAKGIFEKPGARPGVKLAEEIKIIQPVCIWHMDKFSCNQ